MSTGHAGGSRGKLVDKAKEERGRSGESLDDADGAGKLHHLQASLPTQFMGYKSKG